MPSGRLPWQRLARWAGVLAGGPERPLAVQGSELKLSHGKVEVTGTNESQEVPYTIRQMGIYLVVDTDIGLVLLWDKKTSIFINLSPEFKVRLYAPHPGQGQLETRRWEPGGGNPGVGTRRWGAWNRWAETRGTETQKHRDGKGVGSGGDGALARAAGQEIPWLGVRVLRPEQRPAPWRICPQPGHWKSSRASTGPSSFRRLWGAPFGPLHLLGTPALLDCGHTARITAPVFMRPPPCDWV